ncbi:MAG TPA: hypothetical protein VK935_07630, partial [Actinomycetospora sp.]|nr:hypothetical protein [Actinomycetospora sp.]
MGEGVGRHAWVEEPESGTLLAPPTVPPPAAPVEADPDGDAEAAVPPGLITLVPTPRRSVDDLTAVTPREVPGHTDGIPVTEILARLTATVAAPGDGAAPAGGGDGNAPAARVRPTPTPGRSA